MRAVVLALLLAACQRHDSGPPCDQVVDHMLVVMKQLPGHDGMNMTGPNDRKSMIAQCEQRKYTDAERACLLKAGSIDAFADCRPTKVPPKLHPGSAAP